MLSVPPGFFLFWVRDSAVEPSLSEECNPLAQNFRTPCFNDSQDIPHYMLRDLGVVVTKQAFPRLCDPHLCCIGRRRSLRHMDVNRL